MVGVCVPTLLSLSPIEGFRVWMYICLPSLHKRQHNLSLVIYYIVYGASLCKKKKKQPQIQIRKKKKLSGIQNTF